MPDGSILPALASVSDALPMIEALAPAAALFLFGTLGSAHCAAMCSPLVCAACGSSPSRATKSVSLLLALRLGSYSVAGLIAGAFGQLFFRNASRVPGIVLLSIVAVFALITAAAPTGQTPTRSSRAHPDRPSSLRRVAEGWQTMWSTGAAYTRKLPLARSRRDLFLGALFPLLPCGFLWLALAQAALLGDAVLSAAGMAFFALGTTPALIVGHQIAFRLRRKLNTLHPSALRLTAVGLAVLMWGWTYYTVTRGSLPCH
jgi:sulfite exporter TauE/SafE